MSDQHRRPLLAFLLVLLVCVILLGHAVRSEALLGLLTSADREPLGSEQVRLSALAPDRVVADAKRQVRSPRAPAHASATPVVGVQRPAARPVARPAPVFAPVDGGGLRVPTSKVHDKGHDKGRGKGHDKGHGKGHGRDHGKEAPPGLAKKSGGLPPGLAKKSGGVPPGRAKHDG